MSKRFTNNVTALNAENLNQLEDDIKAYVDVHLGVNGVSNQEKNVTLYGASGTAAANITSWSNLGTVNIKYTKLGSRTIGAFTYWSTEKRTSKYWFRISLSGIGSPLAATATVHTDNIADTKGNLVTWFNSDYLYIGIDTIFAYGMSVTFYC